MKRVVDAFKIKRFDSLGKRGIFIYYSIDGHVLKISKYYDVDENKISRIKQILNDYTLRNQQENELCKTLSLKFMIDEVENIIYDKYQRKNQ